MRFRINFGVFFSDPLPKFKIFENFLYKRKKFIQKFSGRESTIVFIGWWGMSRNLFGN